MCKVCVCWWKNASLRITDCCSAYYITITLLHSLQRKGCIYLYVYCEGKIFFLQWSHNTVNSRYSNRKVNAYTALYKFCSSTPSKTHVQQYATVHHRKTTELGGHPVASFGAYRSCFYSVYRAHPPSVYSAVFFLHLSEYPFNNPNNNCTAYNYTAGGQAS